MKCRAALGCLLLLVIISLPAMAQERGQYIPGTAGLNSGMQTPEGITYANLFTWYPSTKFKDQNGNTSPLVFDLDLLVDVNLLAYTTKAKFLGANYGMAVAVPIVNTPVSLPRLGAGASPTGIADLYVEPINLGWKLKKADVKLAYGFVAPTGKFDETGNDTTTTDYWGHQITFATTAYLDKSKLTQFSFSTNWEFHQKKRHEDLKVGNNMTLEAGVGKIFVQNQGKQLVQFGVVGYAEFQLTNDSGTAVPALTAGNKDRVFAIGPELGVILPTKKLNFLVRVLPEFGARNRTQGVTVVVGVGKSF
ncbi:MAG TPA: transporter [Pyrinomonadaceae bacterium]|nr:transporter [Pyrinomonadaceae bacterium]